MYSRYFLLSFSGGTLFALWRRCTRIFSEQKGREPVVLKTVVVLPAACWCMVMMVFLQYSLHTVECHRESQYFLYNNCCIARWVCEGQRVLGNAIFGAESSTRFLYT